MLLNWGSANSRLFDLVELSNHRLDAENQDSLVPSTRKPSGQVWSPMDWQQLDHDPGTVGSGWWVFNGPWRLE